MENVIPKSKLKSSILNLLNQVEKTGKEIVITDHGKPVVKIIPYPEDPLEAVKHLRGSVLQYDDPTEPVGMEDWKVLG
jgi:prevent-host-death family protein